MDDKDNGKALVDEIKEAPAPEEIKAASPVVVPAEPVKTEPAKEEVKAAAAPATVATAAAAAPIVDKTAADRIKAEEKAAKKAQKEQAKKQAKIEKKAKKAAAFQEKVEQCPKDYRPVTVGVFFWCGLLCLLPGIGLIFTLLFSLIPTNKNFKNFARAIFAWYVINLIVLLIFAVIVTFVLGQSIADYIWPFEQFFSDLASAFGI